MMMNTPSEPNRETLSPGDILPPNPIRVETALSRYPVHRLSRKGNIKINLSEANGAGRTGVPMESQL